MKVPRRYYSKTRPQFLTLYLILLFLKLSSDYVIAKSCYRPNEESFNRFINAKCQINIALKSKIYELKN